MEEKFKMMTQQLRITNSDEEVAAYLKWIITSDTSKEYWQNNLLNKGAVISSFYCHDECVRNAAEDYEAPKCKEQCEKCKAIK